MNQITGLSESAANNKRGSLCCLWGVKGAPGRFNSLIVAVAGWVSFRPDSALTHLHRGCLNAPSAPVKAAVSSVWWPSAAQESELVAEGFVDAFLLTPVGKRRNRLLISRPIHLSQQDPPPRQHWWRFESWM